MRAALVLPIAAARRRLHRPVHDAPAALRAERPGAGLRQRLGRSDAAGRALWRRTTRALRRARARIRRRSTWRFSSGARSGSRSSARPATAIEGDGDGAIVRRGFPRPPSYYEPPLMRAQAKLFFDTITNGYGVMYAYASRVPPHDRWAIVAYIRALQQSRSAARGRSAGRRRRDPRSRAVRHERRGRPVLSTSSLPAPNAFLFAGLAAAVALRRRRIAGAARGGMGLARRLHDLELVPDRRDRAFADP